MKKMPVVACLIVNAVVITLLVAEAEHLNDNSSSSGLFSSIAKGDPDQSNTTEADQDYSSAVVTDRDHLDGGFSSLDGMLQWAIGHSDPQKLKETAQRISPIELKKRQLEIKELMDALKMPSDAQLMQIAINDLNNSSLSLEDHQRALQELLVLVEPIENANDLRKIGGLSVLIRELDHSNSDIRRISAWVIGKASQNNPFVQKHVLETEALGKLIQMIKSNSAEEGIKAFYAVSALIRNNIAGQELFFAEEGNQMLQGILSNSSTDMRLLKKAVFLIADLAESRLENGGAGELAFFSNHIFLKSVVDLMSSDDLDLQEKALVAIKNLLQLKTTEASIVEDFCGLDGALERMKQQLQDLMTLEEYAMDVESLRGDVDLIFRDKLGKLASADLLGSH